MALIGKNCIQEFSSGGDAFFSVFVKVDVFFNGFSVN